LENESIPNLKIMEVETGLTKTTFKNIISVHKWTSDSKSLIGFHVTGKDKDNSLYSGEIGKLRIEDGSINPFIYIKSNDEVWLDMSSSGNDIFFTAQEADINKIKRDDEKVVTTSPHKLYKYSFNKKDPLRIISPSADIVCCCPNSKNLAIVRTRQDGMGVGYELVLMDMDGNNEKILTKEIDLKTTDISSKSMFVPVWVNDEEILYWKYALTLAPGGNSLITRSIKLNGEKVQSDRNIQNLVEKYIYEAIK
jgi:hypothetical protein